MSNRRKFFALITALGLIPAALASVSAFRAHADLSTSPASFTLDGAVKSNLTLSVSSIKQLYASQIKTVTYTLKGNSHTATVVPLEAIIDSAQPVLDPHVKNASLQDIVIVTGRDGYTAVFSWAEILPQFGNETVWIALDKDGKALSDEDGPVELLVPNDVKPARWVHAIASIEISSLASMSQKE